MLYVDLDQVCQGLLVRVSSLFFMFFLTRLQFIFYLYLYKLIIIVLKNHISLDYINYIYWTNNFF